MFENEEGIKAAERLTMAISSLDRSSFQAVYCNDAKIWHNTNNEIQTKQENIDFLGQLFDLVSELHYNDIVRLPTPQGFVQHHTLKGFFKDGVAIPDLHACIVATVKDGLITHLYEWLDAAQFQAVWDRLGVTLAAHE